MLDERAALRAFQPNRQSRMSSTPTARQRRILIVEDHEDTLLTTVELLSLHGYDLRVARDGQAAVTAAFDFAPEVVLLDIGLPVMSGYDAAKAIRGDSRTARAVIIAISGWPRAKEQGESTGAPIDLYLAKPVLFTDLLGALREFGQAHPQWRPPSIQNESARSTQPAIPCDLRKSIEDRLLAWRQAERLALAAESAIASIGQAASDPHLAALLQKAHAHRHTADREFTGILRSLWMEAPPAN